MKSSGVGRLNRGAYHAPVVNFSCNISWLAARGRDIPIKHLYIEYRHWLEGSKPFPDITAELMALARQGDHFRRIIAPDSDDLIHGLSSFLEAFDIRTAYPCCSR